MSTENDVARSLRSWLRENRHEDADRVLDAVFDQVPATPQRGASWLARRSPPMNSNFVRFALVAAALVIVAVVGYQFLGDSNTGGPDTTQTPQPTASPALTPEPSAAVIPPLPEGTLAAGTYRLRPFASATMTIDATVPDGGWLGGPPSAIGGPVGESNGPNGVAVAFFNAQTINSDPCHWDKDGSGSAPPEGDIEVGPTVDDLAEALAGSSAYESTTPVAATLGGYSGRRLELQLAPDPSGCDSYDGAGNQYFVFGGREGGQYAQGGANTWQVTIVDVEGTRLIAVLISYAETSSEHLSAAQGILESVIITP
jgi:hypothetical protein